MQRVDWRHRKVSTLDMWTVTLITAIHVFTRTPSSLFRADLIKSLTQTKTCVPLDTIKNKEFWFVTEISCISNTSFYKIGLSASSKRAGIFNIRLQIIWFNDITTHIERDFFSKRVQDSRFSIWHQNHVRIIDIFPTSNRRAVKHLTLL